MGLCSLVCDPSELPVLTITLAQPRLIGSSGHLFVGYQVIMANASSSLVVDGIVDSVYLVVLAEIGV
ncbi:hypothetical protein AKJ16_DCAP06344 [Drosera capensis]